MTTRSKSGIMFRVEVYLREFFGPHCPLAFVKMTYHLGACVTASEMAEGLIRFHFLLLSGQSYHFSACVDFYVKITNHMFMLEQSFGAFGLRPNVFLSQRASLDNLMFRRPNNPNMEL